MKKYRIGIIGYGGFGRFLHHWWNKMENIEVLAIADHHAPPSTADFMVYPDWKELLKDAAIDIVSIMTPPHLHAEMACAAMRAGKHVLLEKPIATSAEGAQEILRVQRETGRAITVNHMIRYNPLIQSFLQLGQSGALGKFRHALVNNYAQDEALPAGHWFWDRELSGGILVEHGVHFFDIVKALGGQQFTEVHGCSDSRNALQQDRVAAMVKYDGGLIASYYHAFSGPGLFEKTTLQLTYDLARIEIRGWMPMEGTLEALVSPQTRELLQSIPGWTETNAVTLEEAPDASRPEGWGGTADATGNQERTFGGKTYKVEQSITGTFGLGQTKGEVYGRCVQSTLSDLIKKIEDPDHKMAITIGDATEALQIALLASR